MGINPTQPNHKAFTFDGTSSRNYGVYITGEAVFNAPQRNVQMVDIPGRNGAYALDKGNFNNITVKYPASIVADNETDFAKAVSDLRNFLCSKTGYCRLEDEYNPDEYRMAVYKSGLEVSHDMLTAGEFDITFECKPQRWLKSGETAVIVADGGTLDNPTPFEAEPLLAIDGYGTIGFNGSTVTVNNSNIGKTIVYGGSTRKKEYDDEGGPTLLEVMYLRDLDFLNNGDNIIFKGIRGQNNLSMPVTSSVINSTSGMFVSSAFQQNTLSFFWEFDEKILTLGTATTWTASWSGTVKSNGVTSTYTFTTSFSYDGDDYIRIQFPSGWEGNNGGSYVLDIPILYGDSTKPIPYNPCYVDLEIGEAYIIENNTILSINNAVSLPSDLPRLSSGTNTFTYDNTVTSLEVTPRWWKV